MSSPFELRLGIAYRPRENWRLAFDFSFHEADREQSLYIFFTGYTQAAEQLTQDVETFRMSEEEREERENREAEERLARELTGQADDEDAAEEGTSAD